MCSLLLKVYYYVFFNHVHEWLWVSFCSCGQASIASLENKGDARLSIPTFLLLSPPGLHVQSYQVVRPSFASLVDWAYCGFNIYLFLILT